MRVATWNVNSIRARVDRVVDWLQREEIDVLAMQEVKCRADQFPVMAFTEAGYDVEVNGFSQWNGVGFASRLPMENVTNGFPTMPGFGAPDEAGALPLEARAMGVTGEGLRLWSLYVPNGREVGHPPYDYKLDWLPELPPPTPQRVREGSATPTTTTSSTGSRSSPHRRGSGSSRIPRCPSPSWVTGTSRRSTPTCGTSTSSRAPPTSRPRSARRSPSSSGSGSPTWSARRC